MSKLYRSRTDKKLLGLCGGLAETFNVDPTLLRLVVVVTAFFSGGTVILLYILASLVIPKEPMYDGMGGMIPEYQFSFGCGGKHHRHRSHAAHVHTGYGTAQTAEPVKSNLDALMKDVETKAMWKEIEELRAKLAKYENGKGDL